MQWINRKAFKVDYICQNVKEIVFKADGSVDDLAAMNGSLVLAFGLGALQIENL